MMTSVAKCNIKHELFLQIYHLELFPHNAYGVIITVYHPHSSSLLLSSLSSPTLFMFENNIITISSTPLKVFHSVHKHIYIIQYSCMKGLSELKYVWICNSTSCRIDNSAESLTSKPLLTLAVSSPHKGILTEGKYHSLSLL